MRNALLLFPALLLSCSTAPAPEADADALTNTSNTTPDMDVTIHPVHHSALVLQWAQLAIYVDPHAGAERYRSFPPPDLILITDIHADHMDSTTLRALDLRKAQIVAPRAVIELLPPDLQAKALLVSNGSQLALKGVEIEGIPMYNMPDPNDPRHPKGRGNGYVVTLGGKLIYISGDTEDIPEMRALTNIDYAFVCMNLPYTMTVDQAAAGVLAFKPKVVYPYHYRGPDGLSDVARFKQLVNSGGPTIEVRLVDWYKE